MLDLPKIFGPTVQVVTPSSPTPTSTPTSDPITPSPTSAPVATAVPTLTPFISPTTPPRPPSSKILWLYIVIGLAVSGVAYSIYAKWKPKVAIAPPLAFYPHSDWDARQRPPENVAINYGLYFHSNVSAGQESLAATDGATSILRKKKQ